MDEKKNKRQDTRTAWHPLLVLLIEQLAPANRKVVPEYHLNRLPQRVDIVVLAQSDVPATRATKLRSIFDEARKWTLLEFKGVTDDLEPEDVFVLLGYACQYMVLHEISNLDEMCLMVVADRVTNSFVARVERMGGRLEYQGQGIWRGELAGLPLCAIELREAYKTSRTERLLGLFTRDFLKEPLAPRFTEGLDIEELRLYDLLCQHIQQLRKDPATMHMKDIDIADEGMKAAWRQLIDHTPIEDRLRGLTPKQRLEGLTPDEVFSHFTPEQLAAVIPPDVLEFLIRHAKR